LHKKVDCQLQVPSSSCTLVSEHCTLTVIELLARQGRGWAVDSTSRPPNGFLSSLSGADFELIRAQLRTVDLIQDSTLVPAGEPQVRAYMPHRGVISLVVDLAKGEHIQVAMVGRDSMLGVFATLGDSIALSSAMVLVRGVASTIDVDVLRQAAEQSSTLRATMLRHGLATLTQIQQTVGCNAAHTVESRLARYLLQVRDFTGEDEFVLTQESMAQTIGARRNSVSLVASMLQQADFIHYSRGHIRITNTDGLRRTACECYATVKTQYERLLRRDCGP
jgi:CRP-like cAMP-binding protein